MAIIANVVGSEVWEQQLKNKKFTVYKIIVQYGQQSWTFYRRYNEFSTLCDSVRMSFFFVISLYSILIQLFSNLIMSFS